jgi:UDP-glucose 4-epimerase
MHILITGGAGFIGAHLASRCLRKNYRVTIIDNLSNSSKENVPEGAGFILQDITENDWTKQIPNDVTHVAHLAAQSSGEVSFEDPLYDVKTNTVATLELLKWSLEHKIKKFVFASSMNVYGNVPDEPITEKTSSNPQSFYGVGKVASENYLKIFSDLGLDSVIVRFFNVYGPGQNMENLKQGMVSIYCAYVAKMESVIVKGDEERFRDFLYIDDAVDAIESSLHSDIKFDKFNICTGIRTTVKELLQEIFTAFDRQDCSYGIKEGTPRDQFGIYGSYDKINKQLGWSPKYELKEGLNKMVSWIKSSS